MRVTLWLTPFDRALLTVLRSWYQDQEPLENVTDSMVVRRALRQLGERVVADYPEFVRQELANAKWGRKRR